MIGTQDNIGNSWRGVYRRGTGRGFPFFLAGRSNSCIDGSGYHVNTSESSNNTNNIFESFDQLDEAAPSVRKPAAVVGKARHGGKDKTNHSMSLGSRATEGDITRPNAPITEQASDRCFSTNELDTGKGRGDFGGRSSIGRKTRIAAYEGRSSYKPQANDYGVGGRSSRCDVAVAGSEGSDQHRASGENDGSR